MGCCVGKNKNVDVDSMIADLNKDMPKSDEEPKASEDVEVTLPPLVNEDGTQTLDLGDGNIAHNVGSDDDQGGAL